jgi:hypothetical protein
VAADLAQTFGELLANPKTKHSNNAVAQTDRLHHLAHNRNTGKTLENNNRMVSESAKNLKSGHVDGVTRAGKTVA